MKGIVEGQCGQSNALVGLSKNFSQNNSRLNTGVDAQIRGVMPNLARGEQFADEYLRGLSAQTVAPGSFNMKSLIRNLPQTNSSTDLSRNWAADYSRRQQNFVPSTLANQWNRQYLAQQPSSQSSTSSVSTTQFELESIWNQSQQKAQAQMWPSEYLDTFDGTMDSAKTMANSWINEFETRQNQQQQQRQNSNLTDDELFKQYNSEWDSMFGAEHYSDEILEPNVDYMFQSSNPFIGEDQLAVKGAEMLRNGNIPEAIQYYEAGVQQNPQDSNLWCQLGLALAENEQDAKAISAFRKSLEIEPKNQEALLAISVSLANEAMENEALANLEKWIQIYTNNSFSSTTSTTRSPTFSPYSMLDMSKFQEVETMFLDAARRQTAQNIDATLQNALGILYNISRNYERAIDSLNTALAVKPEDARLWNRLGATLANGDKTPEAIDAYRRALTLFPTFVRARYNLGISCMHLKSYREAVEHFLSALKIQKSPENSPIWSTMRSAVLRMSNDSSPGLMTALDSRDVSKFAQELSKLPQI